MSSLARYPTTREMLSKFIRANTWFFYLMVAVAFVLYVSQIRKDLYARGLQAGFALAICPNVNQETIRAALRTMPDIESCKDFVSLTTEAQ